MIPSLNGAGKGYVKETLNKAGLNSTRLFNANIFHQYSFLGKEPMNAYQQKWIDVLKAANLKDWKINALDNDILIEMPNVTDLKLIRDNLPGVLAAFSLDNNEPKEHVKFIFKNGHENFEYILNPTEEDLSNP